MEGKVTAEEIDAVDGLPPSKFPRELMVKLGFNPPLAADEDIPAGHQSTDPDDEPAPYDLFGPIENKRHMAQEMTGEPQNENSPIKPPVAEPKDELDDMSLAEESRYITMAEKLVDALYPQIIHALRHPSEAYSPGKLGLCEPLDAALLPQSNTPPEDSVEKAWAELKAMGYPKQDSDPATGETFPVFPENVMEDEEHPLYYSLPDNARPETWRELDSAFFNPSKARSIREQPKPAKSYDTVESIDAAIVAAIRNGTLGEQDLAIIRQLPVDEWPGSLRLRLGLPEPTSAIVEISSRGTFHHITRSHDIHPCEGDEYVRFSSIEVAVYAKDSESENERSLMDRARFSDEDGTLGEHADPPDIPWRGVIDEVGCASRMEREIQIKPHERLNIQIGTRGISIGSHIITWSEITEIGGLDCLYDLTAFWDGEAMGQALTSALYRGNEKSAHPMRGMLLALMEEVEFLAAHGASDAYGKSPVQVINAAGADPDVLLELAKSLPWERAKQLTGPPELAIWLEENHPEHPRGQQSQDASPTEIGDNDGGDDDLDSEWPPSNFRILCAMRARRMAGTMTSQDVERMDEGPPESWPWDLWELLGFNPPEFYEPVSTEFWNPPYTDKNQLVLDLPDPPEASPAPNQ
jgi:hypothetical protein